MIDIDSTRHTVLKADLCNQIHIKKHKYGLKNAKEFGSLKGMKTQYSFTKFVMPEKEEAL